MGRALALSVGLKAIWNRRYFFSQRDVLNIAGLKVLQQEPEGSWDFVVGAGPRCAAPVIGWSRHLGSRSIYYGNPRIPFVREFDALIRARNCWWSGSGVIQHIRPNDIDASVLPKPTALSGDQRLVLSIFVGGNKNWTDQTASDFRVAMSLLAERMTLRVFNSRRTPDFMSDALEEITRGLPGHEGGDHRYFDQRVTGFGSNHSGYAADAILVTADSMSMITEAVCSQRPVGILQTRGHAMPAADRSEVKPLLQARHAVLLDMKKPDLGAWTALLAGCNPYRRDHTGDLANALRAIL